MSTIQFVTIESQQPNIAEKIMAYTIGIIAGILLLSIGGIALGALFLLFGLRWAKVEEATYGSAFKASAIASLLCIAITMGQRYFLGSGKESLVIELFILVLVLATWLFVIRLFFGTNLIRSIQSLLPTILSSCLLLAFVAFAFIPFVGECFIVPTGSMAPTVVGTHIKSSCETCGQPAFIEASNERHPPGIEQHCVCADFHSNEVEFAPGQKIEGDRIVVAKFLKPKRWEIAAFKLPSDPRMNYIKRLVGFPGETIYIDNGSVFINGEKLTPPDDIANIVYSSPEGRFAAINGTRDNPAVLGPVEYFALGDNTDRSIDSRYWTKGAPGHNSYAVPESYIEGVVTTIYWPPKRWRSFK